MSVISLMESNAKGPFLWDWDNMVMYNTKPIEPSKRLQSVTSEIDGIEGFEVGSFYYSGGQIDNGTGSDLGYASSSRSSKSASVDSSINKEMKETKFTLDTHDVFQHESKGRREWASLGLTRTSSTIESSVVSGESLIALELGKRTYFEDVSGTNTTKNSTKGALPPNSGAKKSKSYTTNAEHPIPLCQVEGCNLDLSSAKDYHRKHRVCESHSKSSKVVINGLDRRFCQQCSRFHALSEFDQKKRSCRRRLSDHNARRRKPKPEAIQFNSMRVESSVYEDRNQLSFAFNQGSMLKASRHGTWNNTNNPKGVESKPTPFTTIKTGGAGHLPLSQNGLQNPETKVPPVSAHFVPSKDTSFEIFHQGLSVSMAPPILDTSQHLRALSLLSTSSWGSCDPEPSPLDHSIHATQPSLVQPLPPAIHAVTSEYWQTEQPASSGSGSHASTFQFFKASNEPNFYLY